MPTVIGVAILRRSAAVVRVERTPEGVSVALERVVERTPGSTPGQILGTVLSDFVAPKGSSLAIALSPADLACGDAWTLPDGVDEKTGHKMALALTETRSASEALETLFVDTLITGRTIEAIGLDRALTKELLSVLERWKITLITSVPAALARVFGAVNLVQGGERFEVTPRENAYSWRASPADSPDVVACFPWKDLEIPSEQAAAFAAAICDPETSPNLLKAIPGRRRTLLSRLRDPLLNVGAATILCLVALGVDFRAEATRERQELAQLRQMEKELWLQSLPSEPPREGRLLEAVRSRLAELGDTESPEFPSALAFWSEIGKEMPDPDAMNLTLESLDLAPDGGRLAARVPASKDDPLRNAAILEAKLGASRKMTARGDYEVQGGQVQVRLRMDYKP